MTDDQNQNIDFVSTAIERISKALNNVSQAGIETFKYGTGNGLLASGYAVTAVSIALKFLAGLNLSIAGISAFVFSFPTIDFAITIGTGAVLILSGGVMNVVEYYYGIKRDNKILDAAIEQQKIAQTTLANAQNNPPRRIGG